MIIYPNSNPDNGLYVRGAELISVLQKEPQSLLDLFSLFHKTNEISDNKISFSQYVYTLDWLYILGLVDLDPSGDIRKCF